MDTGAYCRLKNIQLGYSLPGAIINKVGLEKVRIYFSGDNLLTFSGINENFDPVGLLQPVFTRRDCHAGK